VGEVSILFKDFSPQQVALYDTLRVYLDQRGLADRDPARLAVVDAPGRVVGVLRLSGRSLDSHSQDESARVGIRDFAAAASQDERLGLAGDKLDDG